MESSQFISGFNIHEDAACQLPRSQRHCRDISCLMKNGCGLMSRTPADSCPRCHLHLMLSWACSLEKKSLSVKSWSGMLVLIRQATDRFMLRELCSWYIDLCHHTWVTAGNKKLHSGKYKLIGLCCTALGNLCVFQGRCPINPPQGPYTSLCCFKACALLCIMLRVHMHCIIADYWQWTGC